MLWRKPGGVWRHPGRVFDAYFQTGAAVSLAIRGLRGELERNAKVQRLLDRLNRVID